MFQFRDKNSTATTSQKSNIISNNSERYFGLASFPTNPLLSSTLFHISSKKATWFRLLLCVVPYFLARPSITTKHTPLLFILIGSRQSIFFRQLVEFVQELAVKREKSCCFTRQNQSSTWCGENFAKLYIFYLAENSASRWKD